MKILISSQYDSQNSYVRDIADEIKKYANVRVEISEFWNSKENYDIIHIQWPEELFFWKKITEDDLIKLENRIQYFRSKNTKIVATLHNEIPHRRDNFDKKLYELLYNNADLIINFGSYSTKFYPDRNNIVIHHPNYKKHIEIKPQKVNKSIFLSFGNIRTIDEEKQLINAYIKANIKDSTLIISNSKIGHNPYYKKGKLNLKKWLYIFYLRKLFKKNILLINRRLTTDEINEYFNMASVIISPRIDSLNSGVIYMGFSFGKVVIGPKIGNIGEILSLTNNITFIPGNIDSIISAMKNSLHKTELGASNYNFSEENLNPKIIAKHHVIAYKNLLKR